MPVIHLVRHGQASADAADYDVLSPLGTEQAELAGRELARRGLRDALAVSGTLHRQRDTAMALSRAARLSAEQLADADARWNEYDHMDLLGRYPAPPSDASNASNAASVQAFVDHALTAWIDDPAGGWKSFQDAAVEALHEIPGRLGAGRDAVVVTSGGVIAAVCGALLGLPASGVVALNRVTVNTGITTLIAGSAGRISLLTFNDHSHVAADRRLLTYR